MERQITVSVLIIAYNQIAYIDKALRSAQMQTGAGEIEIIELAATGLLAPGPACREMRGKTVLLAVQPPALLP